jgi:hypothetical protein
MGKPDKTKQWVNENIVIEDQSMEWDGLEYVKVHRVRIGDVMEEGGMHNMLTPALLGPSWMAMPQLLQKSSRERR